MARMPKAGPKSHALLDYMRSLPPDQRWKTPKELAGEIGTTPRATASMLYLLSDADLVRPRGDDDHQQWAAVPTKR